MPIDDRVIIALNPKTIFSRAIITEVLNESPEEQERLKALLNIKAKELGVQKEFQKVMRAYINADKALAEEYTKDSKSIDGIGLDYDSAGKAIIKQKNFSKIFYNDKHFENVVYNELTNQPEKIINGKKYKWTDSDDAEMREYIEDKYGIYSYQKSSDAFLSYYKSKRYNPIKEEIERVKWDRRGRIEDFLITWAKCKDNEYSREVSRLIFAGGIHRLYNPGCKFDDMPVLIGTRQGEGKSTLVRWLALKDEFFTECNTFQDKEGIECISGAWICEVSELLAITRAKEQEAVKAFLTRVKDKYRMPYSRRTEDRPRQCIFIGTTNKLQFLTDKTGNRRFYPIEVHMNGYKLYEKEEECKEYIRQCWAEAKALYDSGLLEPCANEKLLHQIQIAQNLAVEDDYRTGLVAAYLENKEEVCVLELWQEALQNYPQKPTKKDSNDISLIMQSFNNWEKQENPKRFQLYGLQKYWKKVKEE